MINKSKIKNIKVILLKIFNECSDNKDYINFSFITNLITL